MSSEAFNPNPTIFAPSKSTRNLPPYVKPHSVWLSDPDADNLHAGSDTDADSDSNDVEDIDQDEIFGAYPVFIPLQPNANHYLELIRSISDPEHRNMSLEQLAVVSASQIEISPERLTVEFTPTVPHCGMSTFIGECLCAWLAGWTDYRCTGLSIRVRLLRSLPPRFKLDIRVKPGSHQSEHARTSRPY